MSDARGAREVFLGFWKVHILHHASEEPVVGQWMLQELHRHGYAVSPGTLYPVLKRMEARGWLRSKADPRGGLRARREYVLTPFGKRTLELIRTYVRELHDEVVPSAARAPMHRRRRSRQLLRARAGSGR
jgi:DNA-binding PadR family transcriptional regulator